MSQEIKKRLCEIYDKLAEVQEKIDSIKKLRDLTPGEKQKVFELGNSLRGVSGFGLGELAIAAGIEKFWQEDVRNEIKKER